MDQRWGASPYHGNTSTPGSSIFGVQLDYYNNHHYHEAKDNVMPSDKYFGGDKEILKNRRKIKKQTIQERRKINKMIMLESLPNGIN